MEPGVRRRMPTLLEVLEQRTASPVDLNAFYGFTCRFGEVDALDFWLDVLEHERMCAIYLYLDDGSEPVPLTGAWRGNGCYRDSSYLHFNHAEKQPVRETKIALFDLVTNAQRLYDRYLIPGAKHEILLPESVRNQMAWPSEMHAMTGNVYELLHLFQLPRKYVVNLTQLCLCPTRSRTLSQVLTGTRFRKRTSDHGMVAPLCGIIAILDRLGCWVQYGVP